MTVWRWRGGRLLLLVYVMGEDVGGGGEDVGCWIVGVGKGGQVASRCDCMDERK